MPQPAFTYYGKDVWEQALAALLCGENLLLAGGKATGKNVLAENLATAFGRPAWDISFHVNMDAASLIGMDTFEAVSYTHLCAEPPVAEHPRRAGNGIRNARRTL